ncbi:MAG: thermostable hemolysin [Gammaproteobacteria bacterium]
MNAVLTAAAEQEWFWESARHATPRHDDLAAFIREAYRSHFGANLASLMPELCALLDPDGLPRAVAGFRHAGRGPLFLEQYLDQPVEAAISLASREPVDRDSIWEIGNLATRCPGAARFFVRRAALELADRGATWAVFTGTRRVVAVFRRLRVPLITLGSADPERLGDDAAGWGSYYDHAPRVVAGRVSLGLAATREGIG